MLASIDEDGHQAEDHYVSPLANLLSSIAPAEKMEDIKRLLHPSFRMRCFDVLLSAFETATKIVGVQSAIKALKKQLFEKKLPTAVNPIVRSKVGTQFTSLYPTELREKAARDMAAIQQECALRLHQTIIEQKEAELEYLQVLNSLGNLDELLRAAVKKDFLSAKLQHGSRPGQEDVNMDLGDTPTESRDQRDIAGEMEIPQFLLVERDAALALAPLLAVRVLEMARTRQANKDYLLEKKVSLKERTILRVAQETPESEEARLSRLIKGILLKDKKQAHKTKNVKKPAAPKGNKPQGIKKSKGKGKEKAKAQSTPHPASSTKSHKRKPSTDGKGAEKKAKR
ncbi:uncharacterized protein LAJ45_10681 [Morchella importuna]|uniref:uncharacterized protein n=1 Tax=Morchella importuna TaxID=1174673 RepID=UPI001E8DB981|nr:uncharacterized protein LAJ45_10681 [Morchella importuna]KAH8145244.1 hypothetical protein LAJ45_10681 [Morchella importuna]